MVFSIMAMAPGGVGASLLTRGGDFSIVEQPQRFYEARFRSEISGDSMGLVCNYASRGHRLDSCLGPFKAQPKER